MDREGGRGGQGGMSPAKIKKIIPVFTIKITSPFMFNSFREPVKTLHRNSDEQLQEHGRHVKALAGAVLSSVVTA